MPIGEDKPRRGIALIFRVKEVLSRIRLVVGRQEKGQTLIEYALLVLLLAIVVIAALVALGPQIATSFEYIIQRLGALID
jgi:pilus assembly protein Flp/PilA